jgi:hypothetical protein
MQLPSRRLILHAGICILVLVAAGSVGERQ